MSNIVEFQVIRSDVSPVVVAKSWEPLERPTLDR